MEMPRLKLSARYSECEIIIIKKQKRKRQFFFALVLVVIIAGKVFAQDEQTPKNVFTVDFVPVIFGGIAGISEGMFTLEGGEPSGADISGIGIAVQYERQIKPKISVAGKFFYLGINFKIGGSSPWESSFIVDILTFSVEGHVRYYPYEKSFFLGCLLGYGYISYLGSMSGGGGSNMDISVHNNYLKTGVKVGWRTDFGTPGGFMFETSLGFDNAIRISDSTPVQLIKKAEGDHELVTYIKENSSIINKLESLILVGGPRITISLGWCF